MGLSHRERGRAEERTTVKKTGIYDGKIWDDDEICRGEEKKDVEVKIIVPSRLGVAERGVERAKRCA